VCNTEAKSAGVASMLCITCAVAADPSALLDCNFTHTAHAMSMLKLVIIRVYETPLNGVYVQVMRKYIFGVSGILFLKHHRHIESMLVLLKYDSRLLNLLLNLRERSPAGSFSR